MHNFFKIHIYCKYHLVGQMKPLDGPKLGTPILKITSNIEFLEELKT